MALFGSMEIDNIMRSILDRQLEENRRLERERLIAFANSIGWSIQARGGLVVPESIEPMRDEEDYY